MERFVLLDIIHSFAYSLTHYCIGFYQFVRRKYKPVKFKEEYSVDATKVVDGIWSYAQTKILEHTEKRPIKKQTDKKKKKKKTIGIV